jgi:hypothetical protein
VIEFQHEPCEQLTGAAILARDHSQSFSAPRWCGFVIPVSPDHSFAKFSERKISGGIAKISAKNRHNLFYLEMEFLLEGEPLCGSHP